MPCSANSRPKPTTQVFYGIVVYLTILSSTMSQWTLQTTFHQVRSSHSQSSQCSGNFPKQLTYCSTGPSLYGFYALSSPNVTGLKDFKFGASNALPESAVKASIVSAFSKLRNAGTIPTASTPKFVAFDSHTPYELHVSADSIRAGFYKNLTALQGQRNTWWTGAAFSKHSSADLWAFTAGLLPGIAA